MWPNLCFYLGAEGLNSSPPTCTSSTPPTEQASRPGKEDTYFILQFYRSKGMTPRPCGASQEHMCIDQYIMLPNRKLERVLGPNNPLLLPPDPVPSYQVLLITPSVAALKTSFLTRDLSRDTYATRIRVLSRDNDQS